MEDYCDALELITQKTKQMLWDTLPDRISLNMAVAENTSRLVLIGKIIGLKPLGKTIIIHSILALWKYAVDLKIEALEQSTFLFHFSRSMDKDRVLQLAPRNFKGHLLVLQH